MNKQKTYFEMITGKSGAPQQDQGAGIEGSNVQQAETMVHINKNESSNGIFQS